MNWMCVSYSSSNVWYNIHISCQLEKFLECDQQKSVRTFLPNIEKKNTYLYHKSRSTVKLSDWKYKRKDWNELSNL